MAYSEFVHDVRIRVGVAGKVGNYKVIVQQMRYYLAGNVSSVVDLMGDNDLAGVFR